MRAVTESTKLMILCTPNNPTGNSLGVADVRRCAEAAPLLLVDAAYADFDPDVDLMPLVHEYENIVVSRTFSKAYCLAGLRVGYVVGDAAVLDHVDRFLVPGGSISSAALHAGLAAFEDEGHHRRQVDARVGVDVVLHVARERRGVIRVVVGESRQPGAVEVDPIVVREVRILAGIHATGAEPDLPCDRIDMLDGAHHPLALGDLVLHRATLRVI